MIEKITGENHKKKLKIIDHYIDIIDIYVKNKS